MAYCTSAQVTAEFRSITISSSGIVTSSVMSDFIAASDAEINSRLSVKYTVPITGTEALIVCQMISVWLVKDRILKLSQLKGVAPTDQGEEMDYRTKALKLLDDLAMGKATLTDATLATSYDGVRSKNSEDEVDNHFDLSVAQW